MKKMYVFGVNLRYNALNDNIGSYMVVSYVQPTNGPLNDPLTS